MKEITTLRDETIQLLNVRPVNLTTRIIAKEINTTPRWVNLFIKGEIRNPGVVTIETLNAFLKQEIKKAAKNV